MVKNEERNIEFVYQRNPQATIIPPRLDSWEQQDIRTFLRKYREYERAVEVLNLSVTRAQRERIIDAQFLLGDMVFAQVKVDLEMQGDAVTSENVLLYLRQGIADEHSEVIEMEKLLDELGRLRMEIVRVGEPRNEAAGRKLLSRFYQICERRGIPGLYEVYLKKAIKKFIGSIRPLGLKGRMDTWVKLHPDVGWGEFVEYFRNRLQDLDQCAL